MNQPMPFDAPVLIAGGGPVGLTLALELAHHGVDSILVEQNPTTTHHPKMDLTNGRSMELYRRFGIIDRLRAAAVPEAHPFRRVWVTRPRGHVLHSFEYPSPMEVAAKTRIRNDGTGTREPAMRISQIVLEPVLKEVLESNSLTDVRFGRQLVSFSQDSTGVTSAVQDMETGEVHTIRTQFLVGCDGGGSTVRKMLGISMAGDHAIRRRYMIHFKSTNRAVTAPYGKVWHLLWETGALVAQDDIDTWTLHGSIAEDTDVSTIDPREWVQAELGQDFADFEITVANAFWYHMVVAEKYRLGRVFLAGDSVHQVIPTGGYGMNTGVGDAVDLGWKLAAVVNEWGGDALLDSYEVERRPIAIQNRAGAASHTAVRGGLLKYFAHARSQGDLEAPDAGDIRAELGRNINSLGNLENESWGLEHGYRYRGSPVIWNEPDEPPFTTDACIPTTWPGARLPSIFLADGRALYDVLGPAFTLLALGNAEAEVFASAAKAMSIPLKVVTLAESPSILERRFVLVRPDHHVVWRGDALPPDAAAILKKVVGKAFSAETENAAAQRASG